MNKALIMAMWALNISQRTRHANESGNEPQRLIPRASSNNSFGIERSLRIKLKVETYKIQLIISRA